MWQRSANSARLDKLFSSSVQALAQMTGSLSRGTTTSAGGIFACQPACLPHSLSQFVILSFSYFLVFSFPILFYPTHSFCHSFSLSRIVVDEKEWISLDEQQKATYIKKGMSQREVQRQSFLKVDIQTLSSCQCLCRWDP